jgi:hypothetical protein
MVEEICFTGKKRINFIVAFGLKDGKSEKIYEKNLSFARRRTLLCVCPVATMKNYFLHIGFF